MKYTYRAVKQSGRIVKGDCIASHLVDLEQRLSRQGLILIAAKARSPTRFLTRRIRRRDLVTYTFHIEQLLHAGVPILEALSDCRDSTECNFFRIIITQQIEGLEAGSSYSEVLATHPAIFDPIFVSLVCIGEETGALSGILKDLSESLKWQDELAAQMKKILFYPTIVSLFVLGVILFISIYLVPRLTSFIHDMGLPLSFGLQMILSISHFVSHHGWVLLGALTGFGLAGVLFLLKTLSFRMKVEGWKLKIPFLGTLWHKAILARFSHYFALMYRAGIPLLDCIRLSQGVVGNRVVAAALENIGNEVRQGQPLSVSFEAAMLFPPLVLSMLRVGENTGRLDISLMNVAYFYHRDVKDAVERAQSLIEPVLTSVLGLLLASTLFSVLGPVFDLLGKLG